jgi:hypothetical protein
MAWESIKVRGADGALIEIPAFRNAQNMLIPLNGSKPWDDMVSEGLIPGIDHLDKWGVTYETVTTPNTFTDIWEGPGEYVFETGNTITHIHRTNPADDGKTIEILYQLDDCSEAIQTVVLAGAYTPLPVPNNFVARMEKTAGSAILGDIYATKGLSILPADIKAYIFNGNNQTQMAVYRTPKDTVTYLKRGEAGVEFDATFSGGAERIRVAYRSTRVGSSPTVKKTISMITDGASIYGDKRVFKDIIPECTEIRLSVALSSNANVGATGAFDLEFWEKDLVPLATLQKIGMA